MRVLIDTNILLDVLLNRQEFVGTSVAVLRPLLQRKFRGFVAATTLTNMYYIVRRVSGKQEALATVDKTLAWCAIASVNRRVLGVARSSGMTDFEDAVQAAAAQDFGIDIVVTRDKTGFLDSGLNVYSPEEFLETQLKRTE